MCSTVDVVNAVRAALSPQALRALLHPGFRAAGWEPPAPECATIQELVREGILRRVDMRCGFERMRDAGVKPTLAGLAVRALLLEAANNGGQVAGEVSA